VRRVGKGSFGTVFLVISKQSKEYQVMKEIQMFQLSAKERAEAETEVNVLSSLRHPCITRYIESFQQSGNLYIVMEYADGGVIKVFFSNHTSPLGDLFTEIQARRGVLFPEAVVLDWFIQICLALKHVHERKILHRDLKTQNIFITRRKMIKLGDFGIAKVLKSTIECAKTAIGHAF
jgi:NIMA (never in mitosis gene a)-related kinase